MLSQNTVDMFNKSYLTLETLKKQGKSLFTVRNNSGVEITFSVLELESAMRMFTMNDCRTPNEVAVNKFATRDDYKHYVVAIQAAASLIK